MIKNYTVDRNIGVGKGESVFDSPLMYWLVYITKAQLQMLCLNFVGAGDR